MDLTHFLAQFLGIFLIIFTISMLTQKRMYTAILSDFDHQRPASYVLSVLGVLFGLWLVFVHNAWSGGLLTIIVTLVGWVILIKSLFLLLLPARNMHTFLKKINFERNYQLYTILPLLLGIYLMVAGFAV